MALSSESAPSRPDASFWRQTHSNFVDLCVLEWCKLFAERKGKGEHCWRDIVADPAAFEAGLLARLAMTAESFAELVDAMRHYWDKFVAHLDSDKKLEIPFLSAAYEAVCFYHECIVAYEAAASDLIGFPDTVDMFARGYAECVEEAKEVYRRAATS